MLGTSVVVYHPHALMLKALVKHVEELGYNVVGQTANVTEAPETVSAQNPDILLFGIEGAVGEASVIKPLRLFGRDLRVLVYGPDRADVIAESLRYGADAYVLAGAPLDDFGAALRQLERRTMYLANLSQDPGSGEGQRLPLTRKEAELLARLASSGAKTADIAHELGVAEQTVKFHLTNIYRKLGVENRTEATVWAREHGLV